MSGQIMLTGGISYTQALPVEKHQEMHDFLLALTHLSGKGISVTKIINAWRDPRTKKEKQTDYAKEQWQMELRRRANEANTL